MNGDPTAAVPPRSVPVVNIANAITASRIALVPVFMVFVLLSGMTEPGWRIAACLTFCVASATDYLDGRIARSFDLVTSFGKVADPIADKALTGTALVLLAAYGRIDWWVAAVILVRELGVTLLRFWVVKYGVIAVSPGGKVKTALQLLAVAWYLAPFPPGLAAVGPYLMGAAIGATVLTGIDYVVRALRQYRRAMS